MLSRQRYLQKKQESLFKVRTEPDFINSTVIKTIKIVLALLFFLCLMDMPYSFYELVRFLALAGFGVIAYVEYKKENKLMAYVYLMLAILFQPLFKISLGRELWNIIDVIVGIGLLYSVIKSPWNNPTQ